MSKKHFFLYDFLLPIGGILALGRLLSDRFTFPIFQRLESVRAFGFGYGFAHSALRQDLLHYSLLLFALAPALAWLVWVRINLERDRETGARRLDRPLFTFFRNLCRWIENGGEAERVRRIYASRIVALQDNVRRLESELVERTEPFDPDGPFESAQETGEEWRDGYPPPVP